jgi:hypothetical protein
MTAKEIKTVLKPLGILLGVNLFPGEPTAIAHAVSVKAGSARRAIEAIENAGGRANHAYAFGYLSESIDVNRK